MGQPLVTLSGRPSWGVLAVLIIVLGTGLMIAYKGLVVREVVITQAPDWVPPKSSYSGPPARIWTFTGSDAVRIGMAGILIASSSTSLIASFILARRGRPWRKVRAGILASFFMWVGVAGLCFVPWRATQPGPIAAFYAFLGPVFLGAGVSFWKGPLALPAGMAGGIALSALVSGDRWGDGLGPAVLALILLGGHGALVWGDRFRDAWGRRAGAPPRPRP